MEQADEKEQGKTPRFRVRVSRGNASVILHVPTEAGFTQLTGNRERGEDAEVSALIEDVKKVVGGMAKDAQPAEHLVDSLLTSWRAAGLVAERMPEADASVTVVLDMKSGRTLTRSEAQPGGVENDSVQQSVMRAVQKAMRKMTHGDALEFCSAVEAGDLATARTVFPRELERTDVPRFIQAMETVLSKDDWRDEHITMGGLCADLLSRVGEPDAAERFAKRTAELTKDVGDEEQAFALALLLGNIQVERGRLHLALEHYATAASKQQNVSPSGRAWLHHNRASVLLEQGDFDGAIENYRLAAELRVASRSPEALEPCSGGRHQLRHAGEVPVRVRDLRVSEIGRERGNVLIDVGSRPVPTEEASTSERVTVIPRAG